MIAAQKVESENEKTQAQVRIRAAVATMDGMAELQYQIAQLMTAQIQTRGNSGDTSTPHSPQECAHGQGHSGRGTPVTQAPSMVGMALAR